MLKKLGFELLLTNKQDSLYVREDEKRKLYIEFFETTKDITLGYTAKSGANQECSFVTVPMSLLSVIYEYCEEMGWIEDKDKHFEEKAETNYEYFKDEIIENSGFCFALVDGKPCQCSGVSCNNCGFSTGHGCNEKLKEWLNQPHEKPTYKLSQFEYDLLQNYNGRLRFINMNTLYCMKEKGYFKGVDEDATIEDILANCEVIK